MQGGVEELNVEELASNLSTYKEQLQQVRKLLDDDPGNSEYADMEKELGEVIALTEELLATAKQNDNSGLDIQTSSDASHSLRHSAGTSPYNRGWKNNFQFPLHFLEFNIFMKGLGFNFPYSPWFGVLEDGSDSRTISDHFDKFPVGTKVQAVWSEDGEWYDATIEALTPNGYYVRYDGWGNNEEVDPANIRPVEEGAVNSLLEAEREAEATKQALKRKVAQAAATDFQSRSLPAKLRIEPDDPEDVKVAKRKKIHLYKSKMRIEQLEVTQNKRQNDWQQFQTTKGRAKKIGFFSGRKRESIFKSPDDPFGKVGVTGSGKGLTDFQKREKHLHLKGANAESIDD
ncbi:unnamed protein product [Ilex paraguariensis]|uniref:Survival of motor neuron-related-splicing factor 30 n=1 Tax=Ilex paraguariensis TaxID=185542 RepID=A0ABC8QUX1_9AQUA